ncbi:hypothetical protein ES708_18319 [subsurface metagenome]
MNKKILKLLVFCFILVFVLSFSSIAYAQDTTTQDTTYELTSKDKMILTEPAICYITTYYYAYVYNPNTLEWSEQYYHGPLGGTGFCVNPDTGHIFTAGHVINKPYDDIKWAILDVYIYDNYPDEYYDLTEGDWNWIYDNYKVEGKNVPDPDRKVWVQFNTATAGLPDNPNENYVSAVVIDFSPWEERDLAVLKITPVTGNALSGVIIGDSSMIEVQDNITIIGYPWNADISLESVMTPTYASGIVSARKMVGALLLFTNTTTTTTIIITNNIGSTIASIIIVKPKAADPASPSSPIRGSSVFSSTNGTSSPLFTASCALALYSCALICL